MLNWLRQVDLAAPVSAAMTTHLGAVTISALCDGSLTRDRFEAALDAARLGGLSSALWTAIEHARSQKGAPTDELPDASYSPGPLPHASEAGSLLADARLRDAATSAGGGEDGGKGGGEAAPAQSAQDPATSAGGGEDGGKGRGEAAPAQSAELSIMQLASSSSSRAAPFIWHAGPQPAHANAAEKLLAAFLMLDHASSYEDLRKWASDAVKELSVAEELKEDWQPASHWGMANTRVSRIYKPVDDAFRATWTHPRLEVIVTAMQQWEGTGALSALRPHHLKYYLRHKPPRALSSSHSKKNGKGVPPRWRAWTVVHVADLIRRQEVALLSAMTSAEAEVAARPAVVKKSDSTALHSDADGEFKWVRVPVPVRASARDRPMIDLGASSSSSSFPPTAAKRKSDEQSEDDHIAKRMKAKPGPLYEDEHGPIYSADSIIAARQGASGRELLVRWVGFGADEDTWEPEENIIDVRLIQAFDMSRLTSSSCKRRALPSESTGSSASTSSTTTGLWKTTLNKQPGVSLGHEYQASLPSVGPASDLGEQQRADVCIWPIDVARSNIDPSSSVARDTAAVLTATAYGPIGDFCFVAPCDLDLGLFARAALKAGQFVCE